MIKILLFLGIVLSVIRANGWIVVPIYVVIFCWVMSFVCWIIYSYAIGIGEGIAKEIKKDSMIRVDGSESKA